LKLLGFYSDQQRDKRRHTASVVYAAAILPGATPKAADDVKEAHRFTLENALKLDLFADRHSILTDYVHLRAEAVQREKNKQNSLQQHPEIHDDVAKTR
jgi:ADP-ribose pyrophosphatase YjhB (NUDIX family)